MCFPTPDREEGQVTSRTFSASVDGSGTPAHGISTRDAVYPTVGVTNQDERAALNRRIPMYIGGGLLLVIVVIILLVWVF